MSVAPSRTNQDRRYWFDHGSIWSSLGRTVPVELSIAGAESSLVLLRRDATHDPDPRWKAHAHGLAKELTAAVDAYRKHWTKELERA